MEGRRLFLLLFALWGGGLFIVVSVIGTIGDAVRAQARQEAQVRIDELLGDAARALALGGGSAARVALPDRPWPSFAAFLNAYEQAIRDALARVAGGTGSDPSDGGSGAGDRAERMRLLRARLALIGAAGEPPGTATRTMRLEPVDLEQLFALMREETPEALHERLERLVSAHVDDVPRLPAPADSHAVTSEVLVAWVAAQTGGLDAVAGIAPCIAIVRPDGSAVVSNLVALPPLAAGPASALRLPLGEGAGEKENHGPGACAAILHPLADGGWLLFGPHAPALLGVIDGLGGGALVGFLLLGLLTLIGAIGSARTRKRKLTAIRSACESAREGDYGQRVAVTGRGALDQAAAALNGVLERTDAAMESLRSVSADIAHDLRTPLTRLRGQLDLLLRTPAPDEAMIAAVQAEADQLLDTFGALLRINQVESGSPRRGFRDFDLRALLADVAELYEPAFEERSLELLTALPEGPRVVHGDLDLWMQSLANLLDNALKYVPAGGTVRLLLVDDGNGLRIILRDTGPGIPELELARVLDRFYRLPKHRGERGNGLGLSLVAAVCELHGARLALRNDGGLVVEIGWP